MDAATLLEEKFETEVAWLSIRAEVDRMAASRAAKKSVEALPFTESDAIKSWLICVVAAVHAHLGTGRYHIGRGELGDLGRSLGEIHHRALLELNRRQLVSEEFIDARIDQILQIVEDQE